MNRHPKPKSKSESGPQAGPSGRSNARLFAGDWLPRVVLPDTTGAAVDLTSQHIAGNIIVLWLAERVDPDALQPFTELAGRLEPMDGSAFMVTARAPGSVPLALANRVLLDPERQLAQAAGLERDGVIVIDTNMRIAAIHAGASHKEAFTACRAIFARTSRDVIGSHAPVLQIRDVLDAQFRRRLIDYWGEGDKMTNTVSARQGGQKVAVADYKRRSDVAIVDDGLIGDLRAAFSRRVTNEVFKAFHCKAINHEAFRVGCYESADRGFFARHRDNGTSFTAHRQFAVTLNLNSGDYKGGGLRFPEYGRQIYAPEAGGAVVFSCSLLHEVLPVTAGRRFALLTFLCDEAGARAERQMIEREVAAGRNVHHG